MPRSKRSLRSLFNYVAVPLFVLSGFFPLGTLQARPTAMRILPKETLAVVRVPNAAEFYEKLMETSFGDMLNDPQIRPFFKSLYSSANEAYEENVKEEVGLSLKELRSIPTGEIAVALIAREQGKPTFAAIIDLGEESSAAHKLLDRIMQQLEEEGGARKVETMNELEVTILHFDGAFFEDVVFIEKENTLMVVADIKLAEQMLALWKAADDGVPIQLPETKTTDDEEEEKSNFNSDPYWVKPLAENPQFVAIMRECRISGDEPPHMIWFADPIGIFRNFARGEAGMMIAVATLPALGLDGLKGVGGSSTLATKKYDSIGHMHILLDNPRAGVLSLLNLRNGDATPERWVPDTVDTYMTAHWDVPLTFEKLTSIVDQFQYDGAFLEGIEKNINEPTGIDLQKEIISQMKGRFTLAMGFPSPAKLQGRSMLLAIELKDPEAMQATMEKLIGLAEDRFEEKTVGKSTYWVLKRAAERAKRREEQGRPAASEVPCFGVIDGYFMATNAPSLINSAIAAKDGTEDRLADAIDYKLIASRIRRQTAEPAGLMINRPDVSLKYMYDLLTLDENREKIRNAAEDNEAFALLDRALEEHPLPPFEVISQYLAPACGIVTDTPTGIHYSGFSLRRKAKKKE